MIDGDIVSVLSPDPGAASRTAAMLGKKREGDGIDIYYRKKGEHIRSILVSIPPYPEKILTAAEALTLPSSFCFVPGHELSWQDGELGLLLESSGLNGTIVTDREEDIRTAFSGLSISSMKMTSGVEECVDDQVMAKDSGYIYLDRVFSVRGVRTVALGFSFTEVTVHDLFVTLPLKKEVVIRSIQVLDEDQDRVGLALKNVELNEIKDAYALVKPGARTVR